MHRQWNFNAAATLILFAVMLQNNRVTSKETDDESDVRTESSYEAIEPSFLHSRTERHLSLPSLLRELPNPMAKIHSGLDTGFMKKFKPNVCTLTLSTCVPATTSTITALTTRTWSSTSTFISTILDTTTINFSAVQSTTTTVIVPVVAATFTSTSVTVPLVPQVITCTYTVSTVMVTSTVTSTTVYITSILGTTTITPPARTVTTVSTYLTHRPCHGRRYRFDLANNLSNDAHSPSNSILYTKPVKELSNTLL